MHTLNVNNPMKVNNITCKKPKYINYGNMWMVHV